MSNGYRLIFIGLLLVLIDIRIETFDILPDFIGYIFIVNGLNGLTVKGSPFDKAKLFAILLIFLSLPTVFGLWELSLEDKHVSIYPIAFELVVGLAHLTMMYFIFAGTWEMALNYEDEEWEQHSKSRWNFYAVVHLLFLCCYAFMFNIPTLKPLIILLLVLAFIAEIVAVVFIKKSQARSDHWYDNGN